MRHKQDILESTHVNALKGSSPQDIALIHSLHALEVLIDIRDALTNLSHSIESALVYLDKQS